MGDRYFLTVKCSECGMLDGDVYYAPTCGIVDAKCPQCGHVTNLEEYTGITYEDASNAKELKALAESIVRAHGRG